MRIFCIVFTFCICFTGLVTAQPDTEVYLLDLSYKDGKYTVSNPKSISANNPGYDNQPSFDQSGKYLYYVATRNGQTDIVQVNLENNSKTWISNTPEGGEYSPVLSPAEKFVSAVQLENSDRQLLWKYPLESGNAEVLIKEAKIGYYCWIDKDRLAAFVLGEPSTLQVFNVNENTSKRIAENIGRSLHLIPGKDRISYISKEEKEWTIWSFNPKNGKSKRVTCSLTGSEDMAWTAENSILMGKDNKIYYKNPRRDKQWNEIESFTALNMDGITRMAVSPDGKKLAVVVNEGKTQQ
ncbi:MAG: hypothetical protein WBA74_02915 [Cyclobacteriaceae bacterium]